MTEPSSAPPEGSAPGAPPEPSEPPPAPVASRTPEAPADETPFPDMVLESLRSGPLTGRDLARAIDEAWPGFLAGREGYLYPVLLDLRRRGRVRARWADLPPGRRRVYERVNGTADPLAPDAAAAPPGAPALPPAPTPALPSERLHRLAEAATRKLSFAPRMQEDSRVEILHHLQDSAAHHEAEGLPRAAAERRATRDLGDPWKIATDLRRAARGQRTVIFPTSFGQSLVGIAIYDLRVLALIVAAIVFVRVQVVTAYHIPTKSMEPTLHGDPHDGDRILVNKLAPPPRRFDVYVFDGWGYDRKNFVKRCVALPGEKVNLLEGDVWIDGRLVRKEGRKLDALLFEVFDRERERARAERVARRKGAGRDPDEAFRRRLQELWSREGGGDWAQESNWGFRVRAAAGDAGNAGDAEPATLRWAEEVLDSYVDPQTGETVPGANTVPDVRFTTRVRPSSADARVEVRLTRGAATYDAVLRGDRPGVALRVDGEEVARAGGVEVRPARFTTVRFSQVDRVLRLEIDGRLVLRHDLPAPESPRKSAPSAGVAVRVLSGEVWIDPVRLERDVYYTSQYEDLELGQLGPDGYFMLGDNSGNSQDSRVKGAVHRRRLVGAPLLVVWPPARWFRIPE